VSRRVGRVAELEAMSICRSLGYTVEDVSRKHLPYDIVVNGLRVQVKLRSPERGNSNRFRIRTNESSANVACTARDVDCFALLYDRRWYVFPAEAIARDDGEIRNGHLVRDISRYCDSWQLLAGAHCSVVDMQLQLF
jgi:hypothetical protein